MSKNDKIIAPDPVAGPIPEEIVFGISEVMQAIRRKVGKLAQTVVPVLIQGESGTGKEILARYIHVNSPYREGPFIKVSCAAIPNELTESELFGYSKGAFTGANDAKPGRVEMAHLGSLYLDEIAELDPTRQARRSGDSPREHQLGRQLGLAGNHQPGCRRRRGIRAAGATGRP